MARRLFKFPTNREQFCRGCGEKKAKKKTFIPITRYIWVENLFSAWLARLNLYIFFILFFFYYILFFAVVVVVPRESTRLENSVVINVESLDFWHSVSRALESLSEGVWYWRAQQRVRVCRGLNVCAFCATQCLTPCMTPL